VTIFSPDGGGIKRAQLLKEMFENDTDVEAGFGFMEKRRSRGVVTGELFAGEVKGTAVFIVDDMISTGGTMSRAAEACRKRGALTVFAIATHALFSKTADTLLLNQNFDRIVVTDTISAAAQARFDYPQARLTVVPTGPLFGEAVKRLRTKGSISDLLGFED
jgi:ribose-phosphate pyrophosphokinase